MLERKRDKVRYILHVIFYFCMGGGLLCLGWEAGAAAPELALVLTGAFHTAGLFFLVFGTLYALRPLKVRRLKKTGRFVWAKIESCKSEAAVRASGDFGYRLVAVYRDPAGTQHTFRSHLIYDYTARDLIGKNVRVYTDPNFRHYYVDAEPLLGEIVEH